MTTSPSERLRTRRSVASRNALLLVASMAASIGACGCSRSLDTPRFVGAGAKSPVRGGTLVFSHEDDLPGLDPHQEFDELSSIADRFLYDTMLDYDQQARLIPKLAVRMPTVSGDGKTFTIELRRGVRFHNGRELEAEDVRWSIERFLDPKTPSKAADFYTGIAGFEEFRSGATKRLRGVRVLSRYEIQFELKASDQTFPHLLALPFTTPLAREHVQPLTFEDAKRKPIGTGPFRLETWEDGVRLVFVRNPTYWDAGSVHLDRIIYELNISREGAMMRFRTADLDVVHRWTPADRAFIQSATAWQPYVARYPREDSWGVIMNCEMAPFDNVHVRRAVAYSIDRDRINRARNYSLAPMGQLLPPHHVGRVPVSEEHRFDLARAKAELREAGFPNGIPTPVTMYIAIGSVGRAYGTLVQHDLAQIGIRVELKQLAFPIFLEATGRPKTAQMLFSGWNGDYPDPATYFDALFHSRAATSEGAQNKSFYKNPVFDAILDRARSEISPERRAELYTEASRILVNDAPWAFMLSNIMLEGRQPYLHYTPHPVWFLNFRDAWFDLPRRPFPASGRGAR